MLCVESSLSPQKESSEKDNNKERVMEGQGRPVYKRKGGDIKRGHKRALANIEPAALVES